MSRNEKSRAGSSWGHPTMALNHLPPKSPSVSSSTVGPPYPGCVRVPNYSAAREHRRSPSASFLPDVEPSWLEDLLDSPKAPERRVTHRRSASDSIAFLEAPSNLRRIADIAEEDEADSVASYDREDHLAALFSEMNPFRANEMLHNQVAANLDAWSLDARPHLRGFHGPGAIGKARMINEAELQQQQQQLLYDNEQGDSSVHQGDNLDPKRSKRQSAQRSRVRKLQYIHELEGNVNDLQNEVSALSTQVALLEHQRLALHLDNAALKQNVAALAQDRRQKDAHAEALEKECYRLRRLEKQQRLRQQLALASSTYNVETKQQQHQQHVRRASAGSVQEMGSAADVVLDSFVKFVEKTDTPVLRSSCTLGKGLEVGGGGGRLSGAPSLPPGFMLQNQ